MSADLVTGATVVTMGAAAITLYGSVRAVYRRTFGRRRDVTARLNRMACETTREYVESLFGVPAFRRRLGTGVQETIYELPYGWLQVFLREDTDSVAAFAITVTSSRLRFRTRDLAAGIDVRLGHDTMARLPKSPSGSAFVVGARTYFYVQSYYLGNPGLYQNYLFASTNLGPRRRRHSGPWPGIGGWAVGELAAGGLSALSHREPVDVDRYRQAFAIDTLKVIGPSAESGLLTDVPGPHVDVVRLLRVPGIRGLRMRRYARRQTKKHARDIARAEAREETAPSADVPRSTS